MAKKLTITTIVKKADECVVYHDDGVYCHWTENQNFNFDLLNQVKTEANGLVILVSEEEYENFAGNKIAFDNHEKWVVPRWLIWEIYGEMEPDDEEEEKVVKFMRSHII